jgi:hypothetical protein
LKESGSPREDAVTPYQRDRHGRGRKTGKSTNDTPGALEPRERYSSFFKTLKDTATPGRPQLARGRVGFGTRNLKEPAGAEIY